MSSFPQRVIRSLFGPKHENDVPVERPEAEFGAEHLDPLLEQVCGMNQVVARACVAAKWNSGTSSFDISYQGQAWNTERAVVHPVLARTSTGVYTWTFASTYKDVDDNNVVPNLGPVRIATYKVLSAFADRLEARAWRDAADSKIIHIRIWDATGTPVDEAFWVEAL